MQAMQQTLQRLDAKEIAGAEADLVDVGPA